MKPATSTYFMLLLVGVCLCAALIVAAPADSKSSEEDQKPGSDTAAPAQPNPIQIHGQLNGEPVKISTPATGAQTGSSTASPGQDSPAPATLVRVRRNKHPIRYHDRAARRNL